MNITYKKFNIAVVILLLVMTAVTLVLFLVDAEGVKDLICFGFSSISILSAIGLVVAAFATNRIVLVVVAAIYLLILGLIVFFLILYIKKDKSGPILTVALIDVIISLLFVQAFYSPLMIASIALKAVYFFVWLVYSKVAVKKTKA